MPYIDSFSGKRQSVTRKVLLYWIILISSIYSLKSQEVPFHRGINLTGWFQVPSASQIQFTRYTRTDFEQIKSLACDVIRLPVNLHFMTNGAPDYIIDPLFFKFLDEVVSWADELEMHLILDNHTFDVTASTDPNVGIVLQNVWTQMASHYKDASEYIYYEVLNEPHGIDDDIWNTIQQQVVDVIRNIDSKHYIVIGPAGWNSYNNLDDMPPYSGEKLIYTFHFYDPFIFTHQGASWTDPSMEPLSGVPFPYRYCCMPALPASLKGTWIESAFNDYQNTGTVGSVQSLLDIAIAFRNARNVPVFCGEFGVYIPNSNNDHRIYWYNVVRKYLEENGIAWTTWDYHGGFGLFEENSNGMFEHDLNVPLLDSLGLVVPEQTAYEKKADSTGFMVYGDYIGHRIFEAGYGTGNLSYYAPHKPNNGSYCISWNGAAQYNAIGFDFSPDRDLSELVSEGYALDFMLRGNSFSTSFDIRFMDTKTSDPADHPWRMRYTFNSTNATFNGKWQHMHIPLGNFTEHGAWDNNTWYNPVGKFDWKAVDRLEIVSEQQSLSDKYLWFDNIHITNMDTAQVYDNSVFIGMQHVNLSTESFEVYPNPFQDYLKFSTDGTSTMLIKITDLTGRIWMEKKVNTNPDLDVSFLPAGIYLLHVSDEDRFSKVVKLAKL